MYPWGDTVDGTRANFCDVNCLDLFDSGDETMDDGYADTAPVGSYPAGASWCGALDLAGNAFEWVADWHGLYPTDDQVNPVGPATGEERVSRGGAWIVVPYYVRGSYRRPSQPDWSDGSVWGFRCAMDEN